MARLASSFSHRSQTVEFKAGTNVPHRPDYDFHRADRYGAASSHASLAQVRCRFVSKFVVVTRCVAAALGQDPSRASIQQRVRTERMKVFCQRDRAMKAFW
jgi:hypothetical protein